MRLGGNELTGPIPSELGDIEALNRLHLHENLLTGVLPGQLGDLEDLEELRIDDNRLTGRLPGSLTGLPLELFYWFSTSLCAPDDNEFQDWLKSIGDHRGGSNCPSGES